MTEEMTDHEMLKALYDKFIVEGEEPQPPGPEPDIGRPRGVVRVTADICHLRYIDQLDGVGKAVWGSAPKGHTHPKRDRYLARKDRRVTVYMDGGIRWGKYKGAHKGAGGNHGWEVVLGQEFNSHLVVRDPKLYILCRDAKRV